MDFLLPYLFYINYEECKFLELSIPPQAPLMFYINYEECKLPTASTFLGLINSFILTMRNVNGSPKNPKIPYKCVLY